MNFMKEIAPKPFHNHFLGKKHSWPEITKEVLPSQFQIVGPIVVIQRLLALVCLVDCTIKVWCFCTRNPG